MAETRRQASSSKVATSKSNTEKLELDLALSKVVGARIEVTTSSPSSPLEGFVFMFDPLTNILAINTAPAPPNPSSSVSRQPGDYHLIPVSQIQSFSLISSANEVQRIEGSAAGAEARLSRIDFRALKSRENAAIMEIKKRDARTGKGVGEEGQKIFDALSRTLPTRWYETSIIVNDAVKIAKPYRLDDCSAPKDKQDQLVRVKRVLENERKKIAERGVVSRDAKVALPAHVGMRKGG